MLRDIHAMPWIRFWLWNIKWNKTFLCHQSKQLMMNFNDRGQRGENIWIKSENFTHWEQCENLNIFTLALTHSISSILLFFLKWDMGLEHPHSHSQYSIDLRSIIHDIPIVHRNIVHRKPFTHRDLFVEYVFTWYMGTNKVVVVVEFRSNYIDRCERWCQCAVLNQQWKWNDNACKCAWCNKPYQHLSKTE